MILVAQGLLEFDRLLVILEKFHHYLTVISVGLTEKKQQLCDQNPHFVNLGDYLSPWLIIKHYFQSLDLELESVIHVHDLAEDGIQSKMVVLLVQNLLESHERTHYLRFVRQDV